MSRPQVTITLGGSGQVIKRAMPDSDVTHSNHVLPTGSKIPLRGRLGSNADPLLYGSDQKNKRQRRDDVDDGRPHISSARVARDDLRFKLMRKNLSRRALGGEESNGVDLREKLSRTAKAPLRLDTRQRMPELRRIPPTRSADDLSRMGSLRKSYSSRTLDGLRHVSPERMLHSRGISPPRHVSELRQGPPIKSMGASGSSPFMTEGAVGNSRPTSFMAKGPVAFEAAKPVVRLPPPTGLMQKTPFMADEPLTVSGLLHSLGLGKYYIHFQAEEVDMTALKQMGDNDLKEMGIPMGPRKKILLALLPRSKQRQ
ncbi:hypothetical protein AAC387_Pa07g0502 [Persea americana]